MVPMAPRAVRKCAAALGGVLGGRARRGRGAACGRDCPAKGLDGAGDGEALNGPLVRGLLPAHSTRWDNTSGAVNDFHVASNWFRVGMGRGKSSPVRAV